MEESAPLGLTLRLLRLNVAQVDSYVFLHGDWCAFVVIVDSCVLLVTRRDSLPLSEEEADAARRHCQLKDEPHFLKCVEI